MTRVAHPHLQSSWLAPVRKEISNLQYSGEVVVCDRWRAEFGEDIKDPDQHFRLVYLTDHPDIDEKKITEALLDTRISVCHPDSLSEETREQLAELITSEQLEAQCHRSESG